jgi:hypothetical protein
LPATKKLLRETVDRALDCRGINAAILWKYWIIWISSLITILQRNLADFIITRSINVNGHFDDTVGTYAYC